jgi:hypothetical protein
MNFLDYFLQLNSETKALVIATILSPIIPTIITIVFFIIKNRFEKQRLMENRLFQIQQLAFKYPYLEDDDFIATWDEFVTDKNTLTDNEKDKYLRYEQYCEMIFNLMELAYHYLGAKKMNNFIDFKSWARTHKKWWKTPIDEYSNRDTYSKEVVKMIDEWIG